MSNSPELFQFLAEQREAASINVEATEIQLAGWVRDTLSPENVKTLYEIRAMFIANASILDDALSRIGVARRFDS